MVFFRAFVMLACLIVVPLAAIFGSAFPEVVKSIVERCMGGDGSKSDSGVLASIFDRGSGSTPPAPSAAASAEMAPRWEGAPAQSPPTPAALGSNGPLPSAPGFPPANFPPAEGAAIPQANRMPENPASLVGAIGAIPTQWPDNPVRQAAATDALPGRRMPAVEQPFAAADPSRALPGGMPPSNVPGAPGQFPADPQPQTQPMSQSPPSSERFAAMGRKLREYGATYYLLETWGNDGDQYRFHCKIAVGNNPNFTQRFEATDPDAMRAMASVLQQIEAARAARTQ